MCDKAFEWATRNNKSRVNGVHGESEAFLVISDTFAVSSTDMEENERSGSIEVEDLGSKHSRWPPKKKYICL